MSRLFNRYIRSMAGYSFRIALFLVLLMDYPGFALAQKPPVDTALMKQWSMINEGHISPDGRYVAYEKFDGNHISDGALIETVVKAVSGNWELDLGKGWMSKTFWYGNHHQWLLLSGKNDSLKIVDLDSKNVALFSDFIDLAATKKDLFILRKKNGANELIAQNGLNDSRTLADSLNNTSLRQYNDNLLLIHASGEHQVFKFFDTKTGKITRLFTVEKGVNVVINAAATRFAYVKTGADGLEAWIYDPARGAQERVLGSHPLPEEKDMILDGISGFTNDNARLVFTVKPAHQQVESKPKGSDLVQIWNYKSENLSGKHATTSTFICVLSFKDQTIRRVQFDHDDFPNIKGDWALVNHRLGDGDDKEKNWNKASQKDPRLVSLVSGKTKTFERGCYPGLSPDGKFVTWFDKQRMTYLFYDLSDGRTKDLLRPIKGSRLAYYHDYVEGINQGGWDFKWFNHDSLLLVKDQYNIWRINLAGNQKPVRLTGSGEGDAIVFDFLEPGNSLKKGDTLLLSAFNRKTKDNGLYQLIYGQRPALKKLFMWPYLTSVRSVQFKGLGIAQQVPEKATAANIWLVLRQSASESPNFFTTADFKDFKPLTDIHPEKACNWMTSELYHWQGLNGEALQGILYKPENFDPKKKYPVIMYYYEKFSDALHGFIQPELCVGPIEIPWFVSRGYLVFTPDIYYRIGHTGQSALSSVESAAQLLQKLPFVNAQKIGINGHSFGGYETNYIVTHSHRFAAASSASGINDMIADYDKRGPFQFEVWQYRIGESLFDRPDLYIENSPILRLKQVTTPLLIMHTTDDSACGIEQAKALFAGLRRLQKPSWLLVYPNADHTLGDPAAKYDLTQRLEQFFDHYLKDKPMPDWMKYPSSNPSKYY